MFLNLVNTVRKHAQTKNDIATSELFGSDLNAKLVVYYLKNFTDKLTSRKFRKLLYANHDSNKLRERLSSDNVAELKALFFVKFAQGTEIFTREFFVKIAKTVHESAQTENEIATSELFGSDFDARSMVWYLNKIQKDSTQRKIIKLLYTDQDSNKLCQSLSSDNVMEVKFLLFRVFPEVAIKNYDPSNEGKSLRTFFVDMVTKFNIHGNQVNVSIAEFFDSRLNAKLLLWYLKRLQDYFYNTVRNLLCGKSDALLESLPLDSALKLKFIFSRVFEDKNILKSIGEETVKPFCIRIGSTVYRNTEKTQKSIPLDRLFTEPHVDADMLILCLGKFDKNSQENARELLYANKVGHQLQKKLIPHQIDELRELLFQVFPKVKVKDHVTVGEDAVRPFCVHYARNIYRVNCGNHDVPMHTLLGTDLESGEGNKHSARLLTWCIERFGGSNIGGKAKTILYREGNTIYDEILPFHGTELQLYLFQVFPEIASDDETCKERIADAYEKLKEKGTITSTQTVFGSQLGAKLAIACLPIIDRINYREKAHELLYVERTCKIYSTLDSQLIEKLKHIFLTADSFFKSCN
ncbi:MAG: hypothetical protein JSR97_02060 [Verrucomicrobia bacterium]|nr:hypothetical protein [Verrucomicrobiota bacterium]